MNQDVDLAIARLASTQHNVFTMAQAQAFGASISMKHRRLASGRWTREAPGVYGLAGAVHTWQRRLMIGHLDLGARSVVSHRSAAVLHGFPSSRPGPPELVVPNGGGRSTRWRVHEGEVPASDRCRVDHIPTTSVTRTVLDLAAVLDTAGLVHLVERLLGDGRVQLGALTARATANRRSGRRGSAALATFLDGLGPGYVPPASELEALLFTVLRAAGLPEPERQYALPSLSREGRVDGAYPWVRIIIEVDGRRWHTRVDDFARDRQRDIEAGLLGWRVIRFTWADLVHRPEWVQQVVAGYLRAAA